jgi:2-polyprenyl-3-methyl-5-hydroxy-6-metoxy-1,4-benzoquinol methylase
MCERARVSIRKLEHPVAQHVIAAMSSFNARHPWSHNDHFHPWILRNLPPQRSRALDVGCGRGELLARLAAEFGTVHGTDLSRDMRAAAGERCAGLPDVTIDAAQLEDLAGPYHTITMVAVLHHLVEEDALRQAQRLLAPGGRLLVVGLAPPLSMVDQMWDIASLALNPVIGLIQHPRHASQAVPTVPVKDPEVPFAVLQRMVGDVLPGARTRGRLFFRHTIVWSKPLAGTQLS